MTPEAEVELGHLMARAQEGDAEAYEVLLTLLAGVCRPLAARHVPADHVDDAVQNVLIAVHRARHTYDPGRPFAPWFHALARHRVTDTWRRIHRTARREVGDVDPASWPAPAGTSVEDRSALFDAMERLTPRQQRVVELLKLRQHSVREVAGMLEMSESAVKVMAHRATISLRKWLGGRDV